MSDKTPSNQNKKPKQPAPANNDMAAVMDTTDFEAQMPSLAVDLSAQERHYCVMRARGNPPLVAGRAAGVSNPYNLEKKPAVQQAILALANQAMRFIGEAVTRENLTMLLFESRAKAGTAMEEIAAVREIGKLHGLYAPEQKVIHDAKIKRVEQLENYDDNELAQIAGVDDKVTIIDGEYEQVDD